MITQIPIEGGSGVVPTGAMQFEHDWPGLWVRGDSAISLLDDLERMCDQLRACLGKDYATPWSVERMMDIIRNEVVDKSSGAAREVAPDAEN